jgi:hypothetical protein
MIDGSPMWLVSPEDLILSKLAWAKESRSEIQMRDDDARLVALFKERSGDDRVRMVSDMFDCARALMVANIRAADPDVTDGDLRVRVFERMYERDVDPALHAAVIARLRVLK